MNWFTKIFTRSQKHSSVKGQTQDLRGTIQEKLTYFSGLTDKQLLSNDDNIQELLAAGFAESLTGLPALAVIAVGTRACRRLYPLIKNIAPNSLELERFNGSLKRAELLCGLTCEPVAEPNNNAYSENMNASFWWALMVIDLALLLAITIWKSTDEPGASTFRDRIEGHTLRDKIRGHVAKKILVPAFDLFSELSEFDKIKSLDFMFAFRQDCDRLRAMTLEKGLNDADPISAEWLSVV